MILLDDCDLIATDNSFLMSLTSISTSCMPINLLSTYEGGLCALEAGFSLQCKPGFGFLATPRGPFEVCYGYWVGQTADTLYL